MAKVFPAEQLFDETMKVARALALKSAGVLRSVKKVIDSGVDMDLRTVVRLRLKPSESVLEVRICGKESLLSWKNASLISREPAEINHIRLLHGR